MEGSLEVLLFLDIGFRVSFGKLSYPSSLANSSTRSSSIVRSYLQEGEVTANFLSEFFGFSPKPVRYFFALVDEIF